MIKSMEGRGFVTRKTKGEVRVHDEVSCLFLETAHLGVSGKEYSEMFFALKLCAGGFKRRSVIKDLGKR